MLTMQLGATLCNAQHSSASVHSRPSVHLRTAGLAQQDVLAESAKLEIEQARPGQPDQSLGLIESLRCAEACFSDSLRLYIEL